MTDERRSSPIAPPEWYTAVLEEYNTLRAESLAALEAQLNVVRFGVALVGVLIALGVQLRDRGYLGGMVLTLFEPMVVLFTISYWLGEVERSTRAGAFVAAIECKYNRRLPDNWTALGWENYLRANLKEPSSKPFWMPRFGRPAATERSLFIRLWVILGLFLLTVVFSAVLGVNFLHSSRHNGKLVAPAVVGASVFFVGAVVRAVVALRRVDENTKRPDEDIAWSDQASGSQGREDAPGC